MDIQAIVTAISTVGFPVVMCGALFWYMTEKNKSHKEEKNALKDAITDLRVAITELISKISKD